MDLVLSQTMADRKKKFAVEKKRMEEEMEEVKQSTEVRSYIFKAYIPLTKCLITILFI